MTDPTSRPALLLAAAMSDALAQRLAAKVAVLGPLAQPFSASVLAMAQADAARVRAILSLGTVVITREAIAALPALGLISCLGSGYEGVDLEAARKRGIVVTHSPGANAASVADLALGLLIASVRGMFGANASLRQGAWSGNARQRRSPVRGLTGRHMGIYGLGAVGAKIAQRALACEMVVGYHNRNPRPDAPYAYFGSLLELARWADVLMISARAGATNHHAVNTAVLRALGPQGHVVNIARGTVIDESALVAALRDGVIAGAGLDVFEHEPAVPDALIALPNVALTPHIAGNTQEAQQRMQDMVVENIEAFLAGLPVLTPVRADA